MFEIALFTDLKNKFFSKSTPGSFWIKSPLVFANHASSSCPQKKGQGSISWQATWHAPFCLGAWIPFPSPHLHIWHRDLGKSKSLSKCIVQQSVKWDTMWHGCCQHDSNTGLSVAAGVTGTSEEVTCVELSSENKANSASWKK